MTEDPRIIWSPASDSQRAEWKSALNNNTPHPESTEHILYRAIHSNDNDLIRTCLSKSPELDCWVHESVGSCLSIELLGILLPAGLDVNYNLGLPGRYLTLVVQKDDMNLTRYLLDHGADVNKPGVTYRFPPLTLAVSNDNAEIVELLIQHRALINGSGALGMAAAQRQFNIMGLLLLKYGADVNGNDNDPKTNRLRLVMGNKDFRALHEAAAEGHTDVVAYLVRHGADTGLREARGRTACMLAREKGHLDIVKVLDDTTL